MHLTDYGTMHDKMPEEQKFCFSSPASTVKQNVHLKMGAQVGPLVRDH